MSIFANLLSVEEKLSNLRVGWVKKSRLLKGYSFTLVDTRDGQEYGGAYTEGLFRRLTERRVYADGTNLEKKTLYPIPSFSNPDVFGSFGPVTVQEQDAAGNTLSFERHHFQGSPYRFNHPYQMQEGYADYPIWSDGLETKTEYLSTDGTAVLRSVDREWEQTPVSWWTLYDQLYAPPNNPRVKSVTTTISDVSPNLVSKTVMTYDDSLRTNKLTDTYEYDFGAGAPGAFLRRSHTDYVTDPNYTSESVRLTALPLQTWVSSDEAGNNKVSLIQMEYDNYASDANHSPLVDRANVSGFDATNFGTGKTQRGNVTAVTSFANAAAQTDPVTVFSQYDILGNVVKTIDAKGNASTISYNDNFGVPDAEARTNSAPSQLNGQSTFAFATSATNPNGWTTYAQFDYFTGASVDAEDINGVVSSNLYNDSLDRPTQSIAANNLPAHKQQTTVVYDDANRKVTSTADLFAFGDNLAKSESFYDGLGRTTESRKYEEDGGYVASVTEYDALSRIKRMTNPYRPLQSEPQLWTTSAYDSLGRVVSVTSPDNAVVQTAYAGNAVTVTDQAGKQRRSITNGLGQLIRVDEPDDAGNLGTIASPNQPTSYLYDTLGKMVKVTQGQQSRFFKYDSLGRLLRVRQPEQDTNAGLALADAITGNGDWSAGFTYDANGNLLTATDTKGTVITSAYDNLNRVTMRSYSDSTPQVSYTYDDPNIQFSKGRLTKTSNAVSASEILSLDNVGRVLSSRQTTDGVNYDSAYSYNLAGMLVEEMYPSGRKVKNSFQTDGDLAKIETMQTGGSYATRADNFNYAAHGAIKHLQIGNGLWESAQFNNRLQVTQLGLGTSATGTSQWKLDYDFGTTDNNGNIKAQTVTSPVGTYAQSFTYDSLDRLKTATETSGGNQTWTQSFTYDRYGNRTGFSQDIGGQVTNSTPSIDSNTNRFNLGQGYTYDAAGNVITDPQGRSFTFNGDNKQTEVKDASNNTIGTYFYDGDGKRIKKVTTQENTTFVYSGGKLVAEYQLTNQTPTTATTQYLGTDMLGSPRVVSDQTGTVTSRRDFMPFGEDLTRTNYGTDSIRQKFTGYEKDTETGLDFAEARYYNSGLGRFTAVDPLLASGKSADPQTFNRYSYTMNNPLIMTDPSGMEPCPPDCDDATAIGPDGTVYPPGVPVSDGTYPGDPKLAGLRDPARDANSLRAARDFATGYPAGISNQAKSYVDIPNYNLVPPLPPFSLIPTKVSLSSLGIANPFFDYTKPRNANEVFAQTAGALTVDAGVGLATGKLIGSFAGGKTNFFTVQSADDFARLRSGGEPFPQQSTRTALGDGIYAWADKATAQAYLNRLESNGASGLQIYSFSIRNSHLQKFSSLNVDKLGNAGADAWMSRNSKLFGGSPNHGLQYIQRGTNFGTEHFFSKSATNKIKFQ